VLIIVIGTRRGTSCLKKAGGAVHEEYTVEVEILITEAFAPTALNGRIATRTRRKPGNR
jgi:hypothetical protein